MPKPPRKSRAKSKPSKPRSQPKRKAAAKARSRPKRAAAASGAEAVVRRFCAAFSRCDVDELLGYFAEDAVYHNIPIAPVQGRAAIEATLRQFVDPQGEAEFEIRSLAARGDTVLTERVDRFKLRGKQVALPVMGAFEVGRDGKIRAWRDYFDLQQFTKQLG
jgi:limonene-1,2-epoxide hydrolase